MEELNKIQPLVYNIKIVLLSREEIGAKTKEDGEGINLIVIKPVKVFDVKAITIHNYQDCSNLNLFE